MAGVGWQNEHMNVEFLGFIYDLHVHMSRVSIVGSWANFSKWLVMKYTNVSVVDQPFDVVVYLVPTRPSFTRSCVRRSPLYTIYGGILFPTAIPHPITVAMDDRGEASTLVRSLLTPIGGGGGGLVSQLMPVSSTLYI